MASQTAAKTVGDTGTLPFLDLKCQFAAIGDEVLRAVEDVFRRQEFILGKEVSSFEAEIAAYLNVRFAIGCASGTDALLLSLNALGIGSGDEVITTPFTFVATAGAILRAGARPVFADIEPEWFNIDPQAIASAVTPRTKAVIPVHLFGLAPDMDAVMEAATASHISVVEDAAQAIGATYRQQRVGTFGDTGCFSFFPSKNLGGAGDGGMVTTNDPTLSDRLRIIRVHGSRKKYVHEILGTNSRLDALQAAVLRVKLRYLDSWTAGRRAAAERYNRLLTERGLPHQQVIPPERQHVYNQYVIRIRSRDAVREGLRSRGIPTEVYYPVPLHLQPGFAFLGYKEGQFPNAEKAAREVLAVPIYPELTEERQRLIVDTISEVYAGLSER